MTIRNLFISNVLLTLSISLFAAEYGSKLISRYEAFFNTLGNRLYQESDIANNEEATQKVLQEANEEFATMLKIIIPDEDAVPTLTIMIAGIGTPEMLHLFAQQPYFQGFDVQIKLADGRRHRPIQMAATFGNVALVRALLMQPDVSVDEVRGTAQIAELIGDKRAELIRNSARYAKYKSEGGPFRVCEDSIIDEQGRRSKELRKKEKNRSPIFPSGFSNCGKFR